MTANKEDLEKWENDFDKIAPAKLEIDGYECDLRPVIKPIKSFISQLLKAQKKEILDSLPITSEDTTWFNCVKYEGNFMGYKMKNDELIKWKKKMEEEK